MSLTFCFVVYSMLLVTVPVYSLELGASPLMLGVILSSQYLLPFLLAIPLGGLVTRHGGRVTLVIGAFVMVAGLLLMQAVPGYYGLIGGQLLIGLAHLQMVLSAQTIISSLATGPKLEGYFGWYSTWLSGGQVVGPLIAGGWIQWAGGVGNLFLVMAGIALLGGLSGLALTGDATRGVRVTRKLTGFRAQASLARSNTGVQVSIAITLAGMFTLGVFGSYLPVYLDSLEMSAVMIGILVSIRAGVSMVIRPFIPRIIFAVGGRGRATTLALGVITVGLAGLGFATSAPSIAVLAVLVGLGGGLTQPLSMVVLAESVGSEQRSGALGMRLMVNRAVHFAAPLLFGAVLGISGFALSFGLSGLLVALVAVCLVRLQARESVDDNITN
ncbi:MULTISPECIES: MFS transporter [Marinobacter]|uniref:MFS transporter n=1 Tax=Marinobacter xiaoshiensis TaxID=3073652 RepID=A0ABU2HF03_9GAMM|nr:MULTISPECIES: MFS transporter [unclassified Marinobacter]MDS1309655.1 MFS transporter [Marinobacter sp. F60267]